MNQLPQDRIAALRDLTEESEPMVRTSLMQEQLAGLEPPLAFFSEDNGYDLHAVQWADAGDGRLAFDFTHLQYERGLDGLPQVSIISSTREPETVIPLGRDDASLMEMSRQLVDRYQTQIRYPDPAVRPSHFGYAQTGILHPGEKPRLAIPETGELAPSWNSLIERLSASETRPKELLVEEPATSHQTPGKAAEWPKVNVPNAFVHPYEMTSKAGRSFEKMIINMPGGTTLNGIDVSGWSLDRFMSENARNDKANGRPVTLTFKPEQEVQLFKGKGEKKRTIRIKDPWTLAKALKASREKYISNKHPQAENTTAESDKPSAAIGRNKEGNHIDMTGKDFNIPYQVNDETRYAAVRSDGANAWNVSADSLDIGRITTTAEGYYVAYSKNQPNGTVTMDPISAATQVVKDAGIGSRVPGEVRQPIHNTPEASETTKSGKDRKSFLEKMQQVTREKFPDKRFGDDGTKELSGMNQEAKHHGAR